MLVLYGMYNSIQFGSVEDKSTTQIYMLGLEYNYLYTARFAITSP